MTQCDKVAEKLSGYIDGELTQQQTQQVRVHIENCKECNQLHSELLEMQADIKNIKIDGGEEAALEKIMQDTGAQQSQQWGWILIIFGAMIMIVVGLIAFITSNDISNFEKFTFSLLGIGALLLFGSVIRQRLIARKTDKYKDINL